MIAVAFSIIAGGPAANPSFGYADEPESAETLGIAMIENTAVPQEGASAAEEGPNDGDAVDPASAVDDADKDLPTVEVLDDAESDEPSVAETVSPDGLVDAEGDGNLPIASEQVDWAEDGLAAVAASDQIPPSDVETLLLATRSELNASDVWLLESESGTCTLTSAAMMLRRAAMLNGDPAWAAINQETISHAAWIEPAGLWYSFTWTDSFGSISVAHDTLPGGEANGAVLIDLLEKHPEGIVLYAPSRAHAVLLYEYDNGVFWCAEPVYGRAMPLDQCIGVRYDNATEYWYVTSDVDPVEEEPQEPKDISGVAVSIGDANYTGLPVEPAPVVTLGGSTLRVGVDYSVSYLNNVELGVGTAVVSGRGSYSGSVEAGFNIVVGFDDCPMADWYMQDGWIDRVVRSGIMTGYGDEDGGRRRFGPNDQITRAQVATILFRYANPNSTATTVPSDYGAHSSFADVAPGKYYTAAVEWCFENGVVTGYGDTGMFGPGDPITREQLATMMYRFARAHGVTGATSKEPFEQMPDASSVSDYAVEAMAWCVENGIISGDGSWTPPRINPAGNATRAQAAKIIVMATAAMG